MEIRKAEPNDANAIQLISKTLGYKETPLEIARERLQKLLLSTSDKVFVTIKNGEIVGWLHAFITHRVASASFVEIAGLAVSPSHRQQGAGIMLVVQANKWAQENQLTLRVRCNSEREGAHKFYAAIGFLKVKEQYIFERSTTIK